MQCEYLKLSAIRKEKQNTKMGMQSIVHGRIVLGKEPEKSIEIIKQLKEDDKYPWIRPKMFSHTEIESPYYYDEPVIAFAATYKYYDWTSFVIKLECLLMKINFVSVKMQLESEFMGHFNFYWKSKEYETQYEDKHRMIETDNWFFGVGHRDMWGFLLEHLDNSQDPIQPIEFSYPIEFDKEILAAVNSMISEIKDVPIGKRIDIEDHIKNQQITRNDKIYPILTLLEWKELADFGRKEKGGYWVEKRKKIEKINTNAQQYIQR